MIVGRCERCGESIIIDEEYGWMCGACGLTGEPPMIEPIFPDSEIQPSASHDRSRDRAEER